MGANASVPRHEACTPARTGRPTIAPAPLPQSFRSALDAAPLLAGRIQYPGTAEYTQNNCAWNFDACGSPSAIFVPETVDQLQEFVRIYAKDPLPSPHSLTIAAGRHSHYGLLNHAFVIDMQRFRQMEIDREKKTGRYGAGLKLVDFDGFNKKHGLACTAGTNIDTGIAGLTLGGGFGWLARRHGLAADNLIGVSGVLLTGKFVRATADNEHADLLWASRGGGGNFFIITEFEFQLYDRGDVLSGASVFLTRKLNNMPQVMRDWAAYMERAPKDISCMIAMPCGGPIVFASSYVGDDLEAGAKSLAEVANIGGAFIKTHKRMPYCRDGPEDTTKWGTTLQCAAMEHQQEGMYYEVGVLLREFTDDVIRILLEFTSSRIPNKSSQVVVAALGGAVKDQPIEASAVGFRHAHSIVMVLGHWSNQASTEKYLAKRQVVQQWTRDIVQALGPHTLAGYNTLGDIDLDQVKVAAMSGGGSATPAGSGEVAPITTPTVDSAASSASPAVASQESAGVPVKMLLNWSPAQYERLRKIKARYDPNNLLRNNNNIPPLPHQQQH